jgi:hypothetical protein
LSSAADGAAPRRAVSAGWKRSKVIFSFSLCSKTGVNAIPIWILSSGTLSSVLVMRGPSSSSTTAMYWGTSSANSGWVGRREIV